MNDKLIAVVRTTLGASFLLTICCWNLHADSNSMLDVPIDSFSSAIGDELWTACSMVDGPCGIEQVRRGDFQVKSNLKIHLKHTTQRMILDNLVRMHPGYRWTVRDGVINVEPANRTGPDLLAKRLVHVSIHGLSGYKAALPVFKQAGIPVIWLGSGRADFAPIDLEMQDVSVRDILNALAKADGKMIWGFSPPESGSAVADFSLGSWRKSVTK